MPIKPEINPARISKADTINPDEGSFDLIDIKDSPDHLGKKFCLAKLNEMINLKTNNA